MFLRITLLANPNALLEESDFERFAASVTAAMPTLRFLALSTGRELHLDGREWDEDVYDLNTVHIGEKWWKTVKVGYGKYLRPMSAEDGERIWRKLIDEEEIDLEEEGEEEEEPEHEIKLNTLSEALSRMEFD